MSDTLLPNICEFISHVSPIDLFTAQQQKQIAREIQIRYLPAKDTLPFDANEPERYLFIVKTGALEQRWRDGVLRARLGPQDMFGFTFLENLPGDPADCYNVTALENTLLYTLPHTFLQKLLRQHPELAGHFSANIHTRMNSAMSVVWKEEDKGIFMKKVREIASSKITTLDANTSIRETARQMCGVDNCSTAVITAEGKIVGLVTDRDMTLRVVAEGLDTSLPVSRVMTLNPVTVHPDFLVMHAVTLMMKHAIRGVPVVENHRALGLLTSSHLVQKNRVQAIFLIEKINHSATIDELVMLKTDKQAVFEAMVAGQLQSQIIGNVMSMLMDAFTRRLIFLAQQHLGEAPCTFAWIAAGSHARQELHMASDQDNAIIIDDNLNASDRLYFTHLALYVCKGLERCGYPVCSGHYMAAAKRWCQPLRIWLAYLRKWVSNPEYNDLLDITVFLESRVIYGEKHLGDALQHALLEEVNKSRIFLRALTREAVKVNPPLGIFNNLVLEKDGKGNAQLNIKRYALTLIIDLARIYGLAAGSQKTETEGRLQDAAAKGILSVEGSKDLIDAFNFLSYLRLRHQWAALKKGEPVENAINPRDCGSFERKHLKDAFRVIAQQQDAARLRFVKAL